MSATLQAPRGRWWCQEYEGGEVWPCEVTGPSLYPYVRVAPAHPAPDAGQERTVNRANVYDSAFAHPTWVTA